MNRYTEKCPICGRLFIPEASNQKYCSKICSTVGRKITAQIWSNLHPHYFRDKKRLQRSKHKIERNTLEMTV